MGNNRIGVPKRIKTICASKGIDENNLCQRAKLLLEIYRDICWHTVECADEVREELFWEGEYASQDLNSAMLYLETFAPDEDRDRFTEKIHSLFEVKWMIDIVDAAMRKVRDFPLNGDLYASILSMCYLSRFQFCESELMDQLSLERTTLYRRKKEAIKVFGLALWGGSMDEFKNLFVDEPVQLTINDLAIGF